jgi:predicted transcriptional regulator
MEVLFAREEATVNEIQAELTNAPTSTAVRTMLKILEDKKLVKRRKSKGGYAYRTAQAKTRAGSKALGNVLQVFFGGSVEDALAAHFSTGKKTIDAETAGRLKQLIDNAAQSED